MRNNDNSMAARLNRLEDELERLAYERDSQADIVFSLNERLVFLEGLVAAQARIIHDLQARAGLISYADRAAKQAARKLAMSAGM